MWCSVVWCGVVWCGCFGDNCVVCVAMMVVVAWCGGHCGCCDDGK